MYLRHASGRYLAVSGASEASLVGIRTNLARIEWEWSHTLEKNTIALRSLVTGRFLSSEKNLVKADKEQARTNEKWQVEKLDNLVFLRSSLGAYLGSRPSGKLNVLALTQSTPTSWFVDYQPDKKLTLRSYQGPPRDLYRTRTQKLTLIRGQVSTWRGALKRLARRRSSLRESRPTCGSTKRLPTRRTTPAASSPPAKATRFVAAQLCRTHQDQRHNQAHHRCGGRAEVSVGHVQGRPVADADQAGDWVARDLQ